VAFRRPSEHLTSNILVGKGDRCLRLETMQSLGTGTWYKFMKRSNLATESRSLSEPYPERLKPSVYTTQTPTPLALVPYPRVRQNVRNILR